MQFRRWRGERLHVGARLDETKISMAKNWRWKMVSIQKYNQCHYVYLTYALTVKTSYRGHYITKPHIALRIIKEIHPTYHTFALFDPPKIGNLMTPVILVSICNYAIIANHLDRKGQDFAEFVVPKPSTFQQQTWRLSLALKLSYWTRFNHMIKWST